MNFNIEDYLNQLPLDIEEINMHLSLLVSLILFTLYLYHFLWRTMINLVTFTRRPS